MTGCLRGTYRNERRLFPLSGRKSLTARLRHSGEDPLILQMIGSTVTHISLFGQLAEKAGTQSIQIPNLSDTDALLSEFRKRYPALSDTPVILAVNRRTVTENTPLGPNDVVALMPPFSGG